MLDRSLFGTRCRTVRPIADRGGYLASRVEGTIRYATENVGRTLLRVDFDSGASRIVLWDDVEIDSPAARAGSQPTEENPTRAPSCPGVRPSLRPPCRV